MKITTSTRLRQVLVLLCAIYATTYAADSSSTYDLEIQSGAFNATEGEVYEYNGHYTATASEEEGELSAYEDDEDEWSAQKATITAYLPKPFALLSMICSYVIIREVVADHKLKKGGPIPRLLFSMAVADMIFSFAYFLGTWPAPPDSYHDLVGNVGSQAVCTFQGFCLQLGLVGSVLANTALSIYFLWVVLYGWSDNAVERMEPWVQGTVWVLALICAIYPIPMELYNSHMETCYIDSVPPECSGDDCIRGSDPTIHHLVFAFLPFACLVVIMAIMTSLCVRVRHIENKSAKYATSSTIPSATSSASANSNERGSVVSAWAMRVSQLSSVRQLIMTNPVTVDRRKSQAVRRQAMFYALAFLLTYLFAFITAIRDHTTETGEHSIFDDIGYVFFFPSAGLFNFLVFARPRTEMKTREGRFLRAILFCGWWTNHRQADDTPDELSNTSKQSTYGTSHPPNNNDDAEATQEEP